ncbi:MAG TPA: hypothetical protein VM686_25415 [Polyangiaceae bacterium]|nr:hypothetical protein [Polyangiaceae bacterium]
MTVLLPLLGALAVPLLAAPEYDFGLMERTELRLRNPGDAVDAEQIAGARLLLTLPRSRYALAYVPRLNLTDVFYDATVDLLHTGELTADFEWRKARLSFAERAAYGTRTYTALAPSPTDPVIVDGQQGIVPVTGPLDYGSSDTTLTLTLELGRRSELDVAAGYLFDGGLDAEARSVIPFVHGPRARLEWRYSATRRDGIASAVEGERLWSDTELATDGSDLRSGLVRWREGWVHDWSATTSTELFGGAIVARTTALPDRTEVYALGGGSLSNRTKTGPGGEFLDIDTLAQVDVLIDRLTGLPDQRLDVSVKGTWTMEPYVWYGSVGHTQSLHHSQPNALYLYSGEVGGRYQWTRALNLEGAFRGAYQTIGAPTTTAAASAAEGFNWVVLVALQAQTDGFEDRAVNRDEEKESEDP